MKDKVTYINEDLHSRLKALAAKKKISLKELCETALDAYERGEFKNGRT